MIAHNIVMQLGTKYGIEEKRINPAEFENWLKDNMTDNLKQFNGGYYTDHGTAYVRNGVYCEIVGVISFILPDTTDMIDVVHRIREMYCKRFQQESVVTTITECEALL